MIQLFGIIFVAIGLPVTLSGVINIVEFLNSKAWAKTQGTVTKSEIIEFKSEATSSFRPEIYYEYSDGDNIYNSNKVFMGFAENLTRLKASDYVSKLPEGTKITVYYKKQSPEKSLLTIRNAKPSLLKTWVGILPLTVGIFLIAEFHQSFVFWFFLLWFFPVIFLLHNNKGNAYDHIEIKG